MVAWWVCTVQSAHNAVLAQAGLEHMSASLLMDSMLQLEHCKHVRVEGWCLYVVACIVYVTM